MESEPPKTPKRARAPGLRRLDQHRHPGTLRGRLAVRGAYRDRHVVVTYLRPLHVGNRPQPLRYVHRPCLRVRCLAQPDAQQHTSAVRRAMERHAGAIGAVRAEYVQQPEDRSPYRAGPLGIAVQEAGNAAHLDSSSIATRRMSRVLALKAVIRCMAILISERATIRCP